MGTRQGWAGAAISMMVATSIFVGCRRDPVRVESVEATGPAAVGGTASVQTAASGTFTQTAITSLDVRTAGPNTTLDQTSAGVITGTLAGTFEDKLKVVIHPSGKFDAHFTITCVCTVDGKSGVLEIVAGDTGELLSPTLAAFAGRAVINGGTGALSSLRGVLRIEGTVDVTTGLATYGYAGNIHFDP
jgi:hypothetical protein